MPAPRAVLIDIMKLGLDPKKPHTSLTKNGRLSQKIKKESALKTVKEATAKIEISVKKEVKLSLPSLPPEEEKKVVEVVKEEVKEEALTKQEETKLELPLVEEVVEVQAVQQEEKSLEKVVEEKQPIFQSLSQQDRFKKKNALKKM